MKAKKILIVVGVFTAIVSLRLAYLGKVSRDHPPRLGVSGGRLAPCPDKPNCVSSQGDGEHFVEPIRSELSMEEVKKKLLSFEATRLEKEGENYAHLTVKSDLFGFVDDVEIYRSGDVYHIRSAARVGYSDMETNRKRVEKIRELLKE